MKEITLRVNDQLAAAFETRVAPMLTPHDTVGLGRDADGVLVGVSSPDADRLAGMASAAEAAGIPVVLPPRTALEELARLNDSLLTTLTGLVDASGAVIDTLAFAGAPGIPFFAPVPVPPPPPPPGGVLPCTDPPATRIIKYGREQGDSADIDAAVAAARAKALAKATAAKLAVSVACAPPCQLQIDLILDTPVTAPVAGPRWVSLVAWELQAVCRRQPLATGPIAAPGAPAAPDLTISCKGYQVGGTASGSASEASATIANPAVVDRVTEGARTDAVAKARDQIADALKNLPHCPAVSCPSESIRIVFDTQLIGPTSSKNYDFSGLLFAYKIAAEVKIMWRIYLECAKK